MKFKRLYEAFSPSMPRWLQNYIMYNRPRGWGTPKGADPEYAGFGQYKNRDKGRDKYHDDAHNILWNNGSNSNTAFGGIDLSRAKFITAEVPKRVDDPLFLDSTKACFVHLKSDNDEMVWSPNRSSEFERFTLDDGKSVTMKYFNNKLLKIYGKDFCYVDMTDPDNFSGKLKDDRTASKNGMVTRQRVSRGDINNATERAKYGPEKNSSYYASTPAQNWVDKSGYVVIPSVNRFAKELEKVKLGKLAQTLSDTRNKLSKLQKDMNECNDMLLMSDESDWQFNDNLKNAYNYFIRSVNNLKETIKYVDNINNNNGNVSPNVKDSAFSSLRNCQMNIDNAYNQINSYLYRPIDWDENDDSIYTNIDDFD